MSLLLAIVAATAAQAPSPPLTLREAQALPPRELATRVLGMAGSRYREARIWDGHSNFGDISSASIEFAGTPRSSGNPGLCIADRMYVSFALVGEREAGVDRRMRLEKLDTSAIYRIVGDANDRGEGTDKSERALEARCARSGPVLGGGPGSRFFGGERLRGAEAYMVARMLQTVIAEARRGPVSQVTCSEDAAEPAARACADPRSVLAALSTDRLRYVELDRCAENATHLCAVLNFDRGPRRGNELSTLRIIVEVDVARADPPPDSFRIVTVTIRNETWAED